MRSPRWAKIGAPRKIQGWSIAERGSARLFGGTTAQPTISVANPSAPPAPSGAPPSRPTLRSSTPCSSMSQPVCLRCHRCRGHGQSRLSRSAASTVDSKRATHACASLLQPTLPRQRRPLQLQQQTPPLGRPPAAAGRADSEPAESLSFKLTRMTRAAKVNTAAAVCSAMSVASGAGGRARLGRPPSSST